MAEAKRTPSGGPTAATREKFGNSRGAFPIWDKTSAKAALDLRGRAKTKAERRDIIRRAMQYMPDEAHTAFMADKKMGAI